MSVPVTITVHRPNGRDEHGDPISGETTHLVAGCVIAPRTGGPGTSSRDIDGRGREGVIEGLTVYAPFDADVSHTDTVTLPAPWGAPQDRWMVDGEVGRWESRHTGRRPGCEFAIRRAAG